ncbi:MAG: hypothetical protein ACRDHG_10260, partial [Anaerolineales bacterium]
MELRNAIAQQELALMRQELNDRRKASSRPRSMSMYEQQMLQAAAKEAGARARLAQEQAQQEGIATMARRGRLGQAMS